MTVVAGIFFVIARLRMAGRAACPVVTVKSEISVVIKRGRFPFFGTVASAAVRLRCTMEFIVWFICLVAADALFAACGSEQAVVEGCRFPFFGTVASAAVRLSRTVQFIVRFICLVAADALF